MNSYTRYADEDLIEVYTSMLDYSGKVDDEVMEAINERGGLEALDKKSEERKLKRQEIRRIRDEVYALCSPETTAAFVRKLVTSDKFTEEELDLVVEASFSECRAGFNDRLITGRTILNCLAGIVISAIAGALIWAVAIIAFQKIYYFLLIPVYGISYLVIRFVTRQSVNNVIVFISCFLATIFATLLAFVFGSYW